VPDDETDTIDEDTDNINAVDQLDPYVDDTYTTDDVDEALLLVLTNTTMYWPLLDVDTDTIEVEVVVLNDVLDHVLPYVDETYTVLLDDATTYTPVLDIDTLTDASEEVVTADEEV
jgi:hypothetical protein